MCCRAPEEWVVVFTTLRLNDRDIEHRINSRRDATQWRARIVDNALQLLRVRHSPIRVAEVALRIHILCILQRILPVHTLARVVTAPHQRCRDVADCAVAIILELINAILRTAHKAHNELLVGLAKPHSVPLDAAIGEVDTKDKVLALRRAYV